MEKAFKMLREIKSVVISTATNGVPTSRIVEIMDYDSGGVYFVTCKAKPFYRNLIINNKISITAMTKDFIQVRLNGEVKKTDKIRVKDIFQKNPSLNELFSGNTEIFSVFYLYKGNGEIFDLSGKNGKMMRERFSFGGESVNTSGCTITNSCIECGICKKECPFDAISVGEPFSIDPKKCDECGICYSLCPVNAIELPKGM
ncbi:4Fe-4S binding protein [Helicovermis profundi]|uniref:Ferredoxin n=1 Tax=Helicovermis profundi TaxID=3065157 RepID=A0AAU9E938_9FIRM|nr:4Fe-4S binding protein [Clostridia bacterium S502]